MDWSSPQKNLAASCSKRQVSCGLLLPSDALAELSFSQLSGEDGDADVSGYVFLRVASPEGRRVQQVPVPVVKSATERRQVEPKFPHPNGDARCLKLVKLNLSIRNRMFHMSTTWKRFHLRNQCIVFYQDCGWNAFSKIFPLRGL